MRKTKKGIAIGLALIMTAMPAFQHGFFVSDVKAATQKGSLATKVTGTWSYEGDNVIHTQTNESLFANLPTLANKGNTRFTTDNYDSENKAFKTNGWSTSMGWKYSCSDNFGNTTYAIPLAFKAVSDGMYVTKPSTMVVRDTFNASAPENGTLSDFEVKTGFSSNEVKADRETDWSTDVVLENASDSSQYMKTTMTQGSPMALFRMNGTKTASLLRLRDTLPSAVVGYNGDTPENSTMLVLRVYDNHDDVSKYSNYDYYALYVPKGTTWNPTLGETNIGEISMTFPSENKAYFTLAWLCESTGTNDSEAEKIAKIYEPYAFNYAEDTGVNYDYNRSTGKVTTTYNYKVGKMDSSKPDGVVMGILPSQYKNMTGYSYLENEARTIRGQMKFLIGDSFTTQLTYSGILQSSPSVENSDKAKLQEYVDSFMKDYGPENGELTKEANVLVNTYDSGKRMNRAIQVMEAAEACGDTEDANTLLKALENELADWFTADNDNNAEDKYFYYDENVGSLFGFPQAYYTVDGMTDHHFHYGYFIQAAAQVAFRDPDFIAQYSDIINEVIGDIAYDKKDSSSKYPYLRVFSTYEGHSWASGHANFADGNNQESSSESINAWAALILYGQATGNEELTDLGVYLYTTEVNSVNNYWFDIDGDILDSNYTASTTSANKHNVASIVWGGKYDYSAWWTAEPLQIQGINLLPITSASYYLGKSTDFVKANFESAQTNEKAFTGNDKLSTPTDRWNELWSSYLALADTDKAQEYFSSTCALEAGDSKAHAYHFIKSLEKVGSPKLDITSDDPLSLVFENKDGITTYVAYNPTNEEKTVTFSDGKVIKVAPKAQSEEQSAGATYKVEYYLQNADLTYSLNSTDTKTASAGSQVTAPTKSFTGYILDKTVEGTKISGTVTEDNSLVLKVYYRLRNDTDEPESTTSAVTKIDWSDITAWTEIGSTGISYSVIEGKDVFARINEADGNPFYFIFKQGGFNATITGPDLSTVITKNCPGAEIPLKASELKEDGYYTIDADINGNTVKIALKKGDGAPEPTTEAPTTEKKTTTAAPTTAAPTTTQPTTGGTETTAATPTTEPTTSGEVTTTAKPTTVAPTSEKETSVTTKPETTTPKVTSNNVMKETTTDKVSSTSIRLGRTKVKKAVKRNKAVKAKISLKKVKSATGYVVKVSTSKKFKGKKTITKTFKRNVFKFKKLKKNKKYYVKARAVKVVGKTKYYGKWSNVKKIRIKR